MRRLCRALAALLIPAASLVVALSVVAGLVLIIGEDPGRALLTLVRGALGDPEGIGYTLFYTTDYVFAGLAVALPFQAGLFNIGGEGQAALGGPRRRHRRRGCRGHCLRHARRHRPRPYRPISANPMDGAGAARGVSLLLLLAGSTARPPRALGKPYPTTR